jgi:acyl dehydratase
MSVYEVVAKNYSTAHENKIHSDEVAQKLGFKGALVPGVAVFGHLTFPMVQRFGEAWLSSAECNVKFLKPAYHDDALTITTTEDNGRFFVRCHNAEGTLLADLQASAPGELPPAEDQKVFSAEPKRSDRPDMVWDTVVPDQPFPEWHLQLTEDGNRTYTEQISDPLSIYRFIVHPHWLLSTANRALTREYVMPAWIHVGSDIRFHSLVRVSDTLTVNAVPLQKWERKGHEFIRLYLAYHREGVLTTEIFHTAIFKVAS